MKNNGKKYNIICFFLALCFLLACMPIAVSAANTYYINGVAVKYTDYSSSPDECWVYANKIYKKIWGTSFTSERETDDNMLKDLSDDQLIMTKERIKAYISAAALGSSLRYCNEKYLHSNDGWGHSQVLVAKSESGFTVFHGGLSSSGYRAEQTYTWDSFMSSYYGRTYKYIKYIKWPDAKPYEPSGDLKDDTLTLTNANYPTKLEVNQRFKIGGYISSGITPIKKATVAVYDQSGDLVTGKEDISVNSTFYDIDNADPYVVFDALTEGIYYYKITATNSAGTKMLLNERFQVGNEVYHKNKISLWASASMNGADDKEAYHIGDAYFMRKNGESYEVTSDIAELPMPNGFCLSKSFKYDGIDGTMDEDYGFGTVVIQPDKQLNFEFLCYPETYNITYNLNGGVNSAENPDQYNVLSGVTFKEPTREGCKFAGWADETGKLINGINEGENLDYESAYELVSALADRKTGDLTVYAKWEKGAVYGDVDGNGSVDVTDYITVKRHMLKVHLLTGEQLVWADVDDNRKIDATDYLCIKRCILNVVS